VEAAYLRLVLVRGDAGALLALPFHINAQQHHLR
jgi:hypothetical protein